MPPLTLKREIVHRFWHRQFDDIDLDEYKEYFEFYKRTCRALYLGVHREADTLAAQTHEHVLLIIDTVWSLIADRKVVLRPVLRDLLRAIFGADTLDTALDESINLALYLWLTIDVNQKRAAMSHSPISLQKIVWTDDTHLFDFLRQQFPACIIRDRPSILLGNELRAVNLERLSGISITWTCFLEDHMLFDSDTRSLKVYSLKQVLQEHLRKYVCLFHQTFCIC